MQFNNIFEYEKLPEPLLKEEIYECFRNYRLGDLTARAKIIKHNIRLVISEVKRKFINTLYEENELISIGLVGLIKSVDTFDVDRNLKFATYATRCIDNEILMFMRKGKKYINCNSLEDVIKTDVSGNELRLEDLISDSSCDLISNYEQKENCEIVRQIVEDLPEREKLIVMLHFGFIGDKIYSKKEISDRLNLSQSYVSRLITKIIKKIKEIFESNNIDIYITKKDNKPDEAFDKLQNEIIKKTIIKTGDKTMKKRLKSIYEYFCDYSKEEVDIMLLKLSTDEKELVKLRYGDNLDIPVTSENWTKEHTATFYGNLVPKMRRLLSNQNGKRKKHKKKQITINSSQDNDSNFLSVCEQTMTNKPNNLDAQEENVHVSGVRIDTDIQLFDMLRTPILDELLKNLSYKESIIAFLKFGYVDDKYYSTESIAKFLEIDECEVNEIAKKMLLAYKETLNSYLDQAIDIADNQKCKIYKKGSV